MLHFRSLASPPNHHRPHNLRLYRRDNNFPLCHMRASLEMFDGQPLSLAIFINSTLAVHTMYIGTLTALQ